MSTSDPSLNAIRVFTAAAEHGSFTAAARRLGIGQPGVSRHIANLERSLGVLLFRRTPSSTVLTDEGRTLFETTRRCLSDLDDAVRAIQRDSARPRLTVDVSVAFATLWLLARLDDFSVTHPHIDLRLVTRDETFDPARDTDVVIYYGEPTIGDTDAVLIVPEHLIVICGRDYKSGGTSLSANEIREHRLLALDVPMHLDDWTKLLGDPPNSYHDSYSSYTVYLQAIIEGHGIGIGWRELVETHLASGLVRQISDVEITTDRGYFASPTQRPRGDRSVQQFIEWLELAARQATE